MTDGSLQKNFDARESGHVVGFLLATGSVLFLFQNCSQGVEVKPLNSIEGGTSGGTDGLRFQTYADCGGGHIDIDKEIQVSADYTSAQLVPRKLHQPRQPHFN